MLASMSRAGPQHRGACSARAIVVGAGPAGTFAAWRLARLGWRTTLVERAVVGRPKCCGHCLNPRVATLLRRHGLLEGVTALARGRTSRLRVLAAGEDGAPPLIEVDLHPHEAAAGVGWLVPRDRLDAHLWQVAIAAGVEARRPASARLESIGSAEAPAIVAIDDGGGTERIEADLVVAADGLGSGIARSAGLAGRGAAGRKFGFAGTLRFVGRSPVLPMDAITMVVGGGGYLGVVRAEGERWHAAGLVDARGDLPRSPREATRTLLAAWPDAGVVLDEVLAAGPMPWRPAAATRGRVALVGDAAGYAEPFTGEGMAWAFESAEVLADAAGEGGWDGASAMRYRRAHARSIHARQRRCRALACVLERPRLFRFACAAARAIPALAAGFAKGLVRT
jgi:flavin-dependent dehydrogenase